MMRDMENRNSVTHSYNLNFYLPSSHDNTLHAGIPPTRSKAPSPPATNINDHAHAIAVITIGERAARTHGIGPEHRAGISRRPVPELFAVCEAHPWAAWLVDLKPVVSAGSGAEV